MSVEALKKQRALIKAQISRLAAFATALDTFPNVSIEDTRCRLSRGKELFAEFNKIEAEIFLLPEGLEEESDIEAVEELYYKLVARFEGQISALTVPGAVQFDNTQSGFKLPRTNLMKFSGDFTEWPAFHDLFMRVIHNNQSISSAQKLQYLKEHLVGEPNRLLLDFTLTDANYTEALQTLRARYDKPKYIVNAIIHSFMEQQAVKMASANNIRSLADKSESVIRGLKALSNQAERRDPWMVYLLLEKLDPETRRLWAHESVETRYPTIQELIVFLKTRAEALESANNCGPISSSRPPIKTESINSKSTPIKGENRGSRPSLSTVNTFHTSSPEVCQFCSEENHKLSDCKRFVESNVDERRKFVKQNYRCFNCLSRGHPVFNCKTRSQCQSCKKRHHTLLHTDEHHRSARTSSSTTSAAVTVSSEDNSLPGLSVHVTNTDINDTPRVDIGVLPTAVVQVLDGFGNHQKCRALLDSGSQVSLVSESCAQRLNLKRSNARVTVTGIAAAAATVSKGVVELVIKSCHSITEGITVQALVIPKVTSQLPNTRLEIDEWPHIEGLNLADPGFHLPGPVDILLGVDQFFALLKPGHRNYEHLPVAQNTIFGWVIAGFLKSDEDQSSVPEKSLDVNIDKYLRRFWEIEEVPNNQVLTDEELKCERHFSTHCSRDNNGRYVVKLPFSGEVALGSSMSQAMRRLRAMECRFRRAPQFRDQYVSFMSEYLQLGHMELVDPVEIGADSGDVYYLPHHGVLKESSTTTKLRVVFDASARSTNGKSLNDNLMIGPTIQQGLISILQRFRLYRVVFTADVEKMYRQIVVDKSDADFQRIVWREDESKPIQHFRLLTVTYGTSCAPFLATRVLHQIAEDECRWLPEAADVVRRDFYVDDLMTGSHDVATALKLQGEIREMLQKGGFNLRKWSSNSPELLSAVPEADRESKNINIDENFSLKVLGIDWNPNTDEFSFRLRFDEQPKLTKRRFLSESARIFNPLGWLTPAIIRVKILFQGLWLRNLTWDDPLPEYVANAWRSLREDLKNLQDIKIPRWVGVECQQQIQIHGFSDASEKAYAAVVYVRVCQAGVWCVNMLTSKTKVAPIQQVSIPRLELCGALLLVRLLNSVLDALDLKESPITLWTDSTIVLDWLSSIPRRWKTFVANRTAEILKFTSRNQWRHIRSEENPSDFASRGITSVDLKHSRLWWHGPVWLSEAESMWPTDPDESDTDRTDQIEREERDQRIQTLHVSNVNGTLCEAMVTYYSDYSTMIRVLAWVWRFVNNCRHRDRNHQCQTRVEVQKAEVMFVKWSQGNSFHDEVESIRRTGSVKRSSKLVSLSPILDDGILRVGGRIPKSIVPFSIQHPIILSNQCVLVRRILDEEHIKNHHAGPSLLISIVRQKFWVIGIRNVARLVVHRCLTCFRHKRQMNQQLMGDLPAARVNYDRAFLQVGVDYAGPIVVKPLLGRGQTVYRAYIALFVCMSTKAVHLELVHQLTTESFLGALRRFVSRRGLCNAIYSDNGTNFVGASNKLKDLFSFIEANNNNIYFSLLQQKISWHFNPPIAPHFGGLWEAAVKSMKFHLRRVIGDSVLTIEEMSTLLAQVEAILNSRPLCAIYENDEVDALTPAHFLIGHSMTYVPEPDLKPTNATYLNRWRQVQQMAQHFWDRWHLEYLTTLQSRSKWTTTHRNIQIDDPVLIKDENLPPTKWLIGRITETHPGSDNRVRVVTVQTPAGIMKRSIHKVALLPFVEPVDSRRPECSTYNEEI